MFGSDFASVGVQLGYSVRYTFADFVKRFKTLAFKYHEVCFICTFKYTVLQSICYPNSLRVFSCLSFLSACLLWHGQKVAESATSCQKIIAATGLTNYAIGNTKVFLKYYHPDQLSNLVLFLPSFLSLSFLPSFLPCLQRNAFVISANPSRFMHLSSIFLTRYYPLVACQASRCACVPAKSH